MTQRLRIVDFSNIDVKSPQELVEEESNCKTRKPFRIQDAKKPQPGDQGLRIANCELTTLSGIVALVDAAVWYPERLCMLDLSCNKLTAVAELASFSNLRILYLQGNRIQDVRDLAPLSSLSLLTSLTIHGNPLVAQRNFRPWIVHNLPQITRLDNIPVTARERKDAEQLVRLGAVNLVRDSNLNV